MATPLINGISYNSGSVTVVLFGVPIVGISKISYKNKQEKVNNYGLGYQPISRGYGKVEPDGEIEIYTEELKRIIANAPNRDILQIPPFDITVILGGVGVTADKDVLRSCEFLEDPFSVSSGDTSIKVTIPLVIGSIER